jgi:hypothetical protein
MIEGLFAVRKTGFAEFPAVDPDLDLVDSDDQARTGRAGPGRDRGGGRRAGAGSRDRGGAGQDNRTGLVAEREGGCGRPGF